MANLSLRGISKTYPGGFVAVKDLNLDIEEKDFVVFVGPSGCGKSTTLRMIAGLEDISQGELLMDGRRINDTPPKDRDMAMVFQNYALYPHMSVYDNIAFGLKLRRVPKREIKRKIEETARMLEIDHLLSRKPKALSGGQRQRVAMGRAIVRDPNMFLLDEPLSNLDAALRDQIRTELIGLHKRLATTFIYVTHDQTEAMTLGTKIVVMKDGVVQQADTPESVFERPANLFVAGFIGSPKMNFVPVRMEKLNCTAMLRFGDARIPLPKEKSSVLIGSGREKKELVLGIRPEHISAVPSNGAKELHPISARKKVIEMRGVSSLLHFDHNGFAMTAQMDSDICRTLEEECRLYINPDRMHIFDAANGIRIV